MRTQRSRRDFLRMMLALTGVTSLAAACGPATAPPAATSVPAAPEPTSAPAAAATPAPPAATAPANAPPGASTGTPAAAAATSGKLPSPMVGVPDGYTQLPKLYKSYDGVPGRGGKVSVFTIAYQPPPTPRDGNAMWQELEKRLGVTWEPIITPQPDYGNKSAALIAGGNLPDLFYLNPGQNAGMTFAQCQGAFLGGKIGIHSEGLGNFYSPTLAGTVYYKIRQADPNAELVGLYPTGPGGAKGVTRNTQGSFGYTAIPASVGKDAERVKERCASPVWSRRAHHILGART